MKTVGIGRILGWFLSGLLLMGCSNPRPQTQKPQLLPITNQIKNPPLGASVPTAANDTVMGTVLVSQAAQAHWFQYDDAWACVQWTEDISGEDLLRFETVPCGADSLENVAFTLSFEPASSSAPGQFSLIDKNGTVVGTAHQDQTSANFYIDQLCESDFASVCTITFTAQGTFISILSQSASNLSLSF